MNEKRGEISMREIKVKDLTESRKMYNRFDQHWQPTKRKKHRWLWDLVVILVLFAFTILLNIIWSCGG